MGREGGGNYLTKIESVCAILFTKEWTYFSYYHSIYTFKMFSPGEFISSTNSEQHFQDFPGHWVNSKKVVAKSSAFISSSFFLFYHAFVLWTSKILMLKHKLYCKPNVDDSSRQLVENMFCVFLQQLNLFCLAL